MSFGPLFKSGERGASGLVSASEPITVRGASSALRPLCGGCAAQEVSKAIGLCMIEGYIRNKHPALSMMKPHTPKPSKHRQSYERLQTFTKPTLYRQNALSNH